jgi:hypothetical protein
MNGYNNVTQDWFFSRQKRHNYNSNSYNTNNQFLLKLVHHILIYYI